MGQSQDSLVLHVSHTSTVSGAEHSLLTLMEAMPREKVAGIACPPGDLADRAEAMGLAVYPLPELRASLRVTPRNLPTMGWRTLRGVIAVRKAARRAKATVIHANSTRASLLAGYAHSLGGPPVVAHIRDALPCGRLSLRLNRAVRRRAQHIVALSNYVADAFAVGNDRGAPISVVDNPVKLGRFLNGKQDAEGLRDLWGNGDAPLLGIIGQITSWKGHDTAVRALALLSDHPDARLLVVGGIKFADSSTRLDNRGFLADLEQEITELGLDDRIVFTGERHDIPAVLAALDAVLVPSHGEPFGRTVAEAMVAGTPVIASADGGPAEIIDHGITGLLVPPGEPAEWARAIGYVLGNPDRAMRVAERGQRLAVTRFDERLHAARMLQILGSASASSGGRARRLSRGSLRAERAPARAG